MTDFQFVQLVNRLHYGGFKKGDAVQKAQAIRTLKKDFGMKVSLEMHPRTGRIRLRAN